MIVGGRRSDRSSRSTVTGRRLAGKQPNRWRPERLSPPLSTLAGVFSGDGGVYSHVKYVAGRRRRRSAPAARSEVAGRRRGNAGKFRSAAAKPSSGETFGVFSGDLGRRQVVGGAQNSSTDSTLAGGGGGGTGGAPTAALRRPEVRKKK